MRSAKSSMVSQKLTRYCPDLRFQALPEHAKQALAYYMCRPMRRKDHGVSHAALVQLSADNASRESSPLRAASFRKFAPA